MFPQLISVLVVMSFAYPTPQVRLSNAAALKIATWNSHGLTPLKKELVRSLDYDIVCLPETHMYTDDDKLMLYAAPPPKNDPYSGVSLMLSSRVTKYVTHWDFIGSRIIYCRLKGQVCNYFVIGIYIPQKKRQNPDQSTTYDQLEKLLQSIGRRDCVILLGDFNSRLKRDIENHTGHWSIHNKNDAGGDRLLQIMQMFSMKCISTCFQPPRRHSNATYINVQPHLPPSQIDHIIVSTRWSSSVRCCKSMWGLSMKAHGRKYDHALVMMTFKLKQRNKRPSLKRDFQSLKSPEVAKNFENKLTEVLSTTSQPQDTSASWIRLKTALQSAKEVLPVIPKKSSRKYQASENTQQLVEKRKVMWDKSTPDERKALTKAIKRSARRDYRTHVDQICSDIEAADRVGDTTSVYKIAKVLTSKGNGNKFCQPSIDEHGNQITSTEQQLESWAVFLEKKFAARPDETMPDLAACPEEEIIPDLAIEETEACLGKMKSGKAPGPDGNPAELYCNDTATAELHHVLERIFNTEEIPSDFVLGEMLNFFKKKDKDDRANYRALGLLNHGYKIFSRILLTRIIPYIDPKLSDTQAGFRKGRGCRDNILILNMAIQHLLKKESDSDESHGVITYIDFVAAFDSILHSYMIQALLDYGVPKKYCRLVAKIYQTAAVQVRIIETSGERKLSRTISIRRGAIQGDIPSPVYFLVALDKLLKNHGRIEESGIPIAPGLTLVDLAYADDAGLADTDVTKASTRITNLDTKGREEAGMTISVPKTKNQHICKKPKVSETTEDDIKNLPAAEAFKHICEKCDRPFKTKHGLSIHKARWCKGRRKHKPASRKGSVADRVIQLRKVKEKQQELPRVMLGNEYLENVYAFVYLGSEVAGDGDPLIPAKHRTDIAWGRFADYRPVLTSTKLGVSLRLRLFVAIVGSTMLHGSSAWFAVDQVKRMINGVNSKLTSQITKRTIHQEAKHPSYDIISAMLQRRWSYLGHILRMDEDRTVRRFLLELSPTSAPFPAGSLLEQMPFETVEEAVTVAHNRERWRETFNDGDLL